MRVALLIALSLGVALSGCGRVRDSRLNPFNWFGRAEPAAVVAVAMIVGGGILLVRAFMRRA